MIFCMGLTFCLCSAVRRANSRHGRPISLCASLLRSRSKSACQLMIPSTCVKNCLFSYRTYEDYFTSLFSRRPRVENVRARIQLIGRPGANHRRPCRVVLNANACSTRAIIFVGNAPTFLTFPRPHPCSIAHTTYTHLYTNHVQLSPPRDTP